MKTARFSPFFLLLLLLSARLFADGTQTGVLVGTVADEAGGPLPQVRVILQGKRGTQEVVTDESGAFLDLAVRSGMPLRPIVDKLRKRSPSDEFEEALSPAIPREVTEALALWNEGEPNAAQDLLPLVYDELRGLARSHLRRRRPGHTLQPTALVHEAYLRLEGKENPPWKDRVHFYAVTAKIMRGILVDHARAHNAEKRGGGAARVTLDDALEARGKGTDLIELDDALRSLSTFDPQKSRIIELRFFGGLSLEETAGLLGISTATVVNETRRARAWLYREIAGGQEGDGDP